MMRWEKLDVVNRRPTEEDEIGKKKRGRKGGRDGPGKKWGHTLNVIKGGKQVYVIGGYGNEENQSNEVFMYTASTDRWSKPYFKGVPLPPRDSHTTTLIGQKLYVFGGTDGNSGLNDLHTLDISTNTWEVQILKSFVTPRPREGHSATSIGSKIYVFGGCGKKQAAGEDLYFNDLFVFDSEIEEWILVKPKGDLPLPRDSHSCNAWGGKLVLFGGEVSHGSFVDDVHIFDTETLTWSILPTSGFAPSPRAGHSAVVIGDSLVVFGGFSENRHLFNDLFVLELATGKWSAPTTTGIPPSPRFSLGADLADPLTGQILFHGGCNQLLQPLGDMFVLHTGLTQPQPPIPPSAKASAKRKAKKKKVHQVEGGTRRSKEVEGQTNFLGIEEVGRRFLGAELTQPIVANTREVSEERAFEARITDVFHFGYFLEAKVDNFKLEGMLFSFKPEFEHAAQVRIHQRRTHEGIARAARKESKRSLKLKQKLEALEMAARELGLRGGEWDGRKGEKKGGQEEKKGNDEHGKGKEVCAEEGDVTTCAEGGVTK